MGNASYSVIRYIPDPGRGESLNIGIVVWDERQFRLAVNDKAVARVIRENPRLESDALLYVEPLLRERLESGSGSVPKRVEHMLTTQKGFPIDLSEPRFTRVDGSAELDAALHRLSGRIVEPKRRTGAPQDDVRRMVERGLAAFLKSNRIMQNHFFGASLTGVQRRADFYANSTANVALDVLPLVLQRADAVRQKADAEAMKVYDVLGGDGAPSAYVVFCNFGPHVGDEVNGDARRVIEAQGARVVTDVGEATSVMARAAAG